MLTNRNFLDAMPGALIACWTNLSTDQDRAIWNQLVLCILAAESTNVQDDARAQSAMNYLTVAIIEPLQNQNAIELRQSAQFLASAIAEDFNNYVKSAEEIINKKANQQQIVSEELSKLIKYCLARDEQELKLLSDYYKTRANLVKHLASLPENKADVKNAKQDILNEIEVVLAGAPESDHSEQKQKINLLTQVMTTIAQKNIDEDKYRALTVTISQKPWGVNLAKVMSALPLILLAVAGAVCIVATAGAAAPLVAGVVATILVVSTSATGLGAVGCGIAAGVLLWKRNKQNAVEGKLTDAHQHVVAPAAA